MVEAGVGVVAVEAVVEAVGVAAGVVAAVVASECSRHHGLDCSSGTAPMQPWSIAIRVRPARRIALLRILRPAIVGAAVVPC